jgi:chaperone modulatory protein CbpM
MMITEADIVARFQGLEIKVLQQWITVGWVKPTPSESGFLFDEIDVARTHLLCDLRFQMDLRDEELALVLSLLDQLHGTRALLRAVAAAINDQPVEVREAILSKIGAALPGA